MVAGERLEPDPNDPVLAVPRGNKQDEFPVLLDILFYDAHRTDLYQLRAVSHRGERSAPLDAEEYRANRFRGAALGSSRRVRRSLPALR